MRLRACRGIALDLRSAAQLPQPDGIFAPMLKISAGLVMYRIRGGQLEFLLVHPGGPFWAKKDAGAWFIPKGEVNPEEDLLAAAKREFAEEIGFRPEGSFVSLGSVR